MTRNDTSDEVALLKRTIRAQLNMAARDGIVAGAEALGVLVSLSAEIIAKVDDEERRQRIVADVVETLPIIVTIEREVPEGTTWQ